MPTILEPELQRKPNSDRSQPRSTWTIFLLPIAPAIVLFLAWWHGSLSTTKALIGWILCGGLFALLSLSAAVRKRLDSFLHQISERLAQWIGQALLFLVFFGFLTPLGLLLRALGKDPLPKRPDPTRPSYWDPPTRNGGLDKMF